MANAVPVHSTRTKGKQSDVKQPEAPSTESVQQGDESVQQPGGQDSAPVVQVVTPKGIKLESHDAYRVDH